jgi:hypothetical protein
MNYIIFDYNNYIKEYQSLKKENVYNHYLKKNKKNISLFINRHFLNEYIKNKFKNCKLNMKIGNNYYINIKNIVYKFTGKLDVFKIDNFIYNILHNHNKYIDYLDIKDDLVILIPAWKRHKIMKRCMDSLKKMGLQKKIIYLVSNFNDLRFVINNGFFYEVSVNKPLGLKFNNLIKIVKKIKCKYFMILGSDDILEEDYINKSLNLLKDKKYDVVGTDTQVIHINKDIYKRTYNGHYNRTFGSGRIYRKKMAEKLNYNFFNENINKNLDRSVTFKIKKNNLKMGIVDSNIISYYCEDNHITNYKYMYFNNNKMVKIN